MLVYSLHVPGLGWGSADLDSPGWSLLWAVDLLLLLHWALILVGPAGFRASSHGHDTNTRGKCTGMLQAFVCMCLLKSYWPKQFRWTSPVNINGAENILYPWWWGKGLQVPMQRLCIGEERRGRTALKSITPGLQSTWRRRLHRGAAEKPGGLSPLSSCNCSLSFPLQGGTRAMADGLPSPFGMALNYLCTLVHWFPAFCPQSGRAGAVEFFTLAPQRVFIDLGSPEMQTGWMSSGYFRDLSPFICIPLSLHVRVASVSMRRPERRAPSSSLEMEAHARGYCPVFEAVTMCLWTGHGSRSTTCRDFYIRRPGNTGQYGR